MQTRASSRGSLVEAAVSRTQRGYSSRGRFDSRSRSRESRSWTRRGSRNAGCKPRGIDRFGHGLVSKEPTRIVDNDRVEGALDEPVREFGLRGRSHNRKLDSSRVVTLGNNATRRKAFWNADSRAPNRALGDASWWSGSTRRRVVEGRMRACSGRAVEWNRPERASNTTENVRDRSRFGKGSSSTSSGVRRVSEQQAHIHIGLVCSIETTSIEANASE